MVLGVVLKCSQNGRPSALAARLNSRMLIASALPSKTSAPQNQIVDQERAVIWGLAQDACDALIDRKAATGEED